MNKPMTESELQHIEHCNKVLQEHGELVEKVVNQTEALLNSYVPILAAYVGSVAELRNKFGQEISHMLRSVNELKMLTSRTSEIIKFGQAVESIKGLLTDETVTRLRAVLGAEQNG